MDYVREYCKNIRIMTCSYAKYYHTNIQPKCSYAQ